MLNPQAFDVVFGTGTGETELFTAWMNKALALPSLCGQLRSCLSPGLRFHVEDADLLRPR